MGCTIRGVKPLDFEVARRLVIDTVRPLAETRATESVPLLQAHGRILALPVNADRDYPALARSLRDGFAVKAEDVPGKLHVRGEVRAGDEQQAPLGNGEALEIMTGAPLPAGANAVVMVEHVTRIGSEVRIDAPAESGQFINNRGAEAASGSVLIPPNTRLDASHIASLAMTGHSDVTVFTKPSVAILATGDEIVAINQTPAPHQIRNSNSFMLASLIQVAGGIPTILPVAHDTKEDLLPLLRLGMEHDLLIVSGGVSAGKYDLVKPSLRDLGAEFLFERIRLQPGQPTAFGIANGKPLFGLPGNPGSSLITYQLFARPALELLSGLGEPIQPLSPSPSKPLSNINSDSPVSSPPDLVPTASTSVTSPGKAPATSPPSPKPTASSLPTTTANPGPSAIPSA